MIEKVKIYSKWSIKCPLHLTEDYFKHTMAASILEGGNWIQVVAPDENRSVALRHILKTGSLI